MNAKSSPSVSNAGPLLAAAGALAVLAAAPGDALAHGGSTIAQGSRDGVTVLVQGTDGTTPGGKPAADVSAILNGPGTGKDATVVFWIRPEAGKTFKVEADRDPTQTRHAEVSTAGRGDWRAWDVSAVVTLSSGERLRVTNAPGNAPGPDPAAAAKPTTAEPETPTSPTASESPVATSDTEVSQPVADVSGESAGAPAWAIPSLVVLVVLGLFGLALQRRRSAR